MEEQKALAPKVGNSLHKVERDSMKMICRDEEP